MKDNGKIRNLSALNIDTWGCLDMDGGDFYVDLFGIQWEQDEENTMLFPGERDEDEDAGMVEVNTLVVSADAGALNTETSFCQSEGCIEEEDKLDEGHDSDNVFCRTFSTVSCCSSTSSALNLGLLDSCIDCCNCVDDIHSSSCIDNIDVEICMNCGCMNYSGSKICINCLFDLESIAERPGQTCNVIHTFGQSKVCSEGNQVSSDEQI